MAAPVSKWVALPLLVVFAASALFTSGNGQDRTAADRDAAALLSPAVAPGNPLFDPCQRKRPHSSVFASQAFPCLPLSAFDFMQARSSLASTFLPKGRIIPSSILFHVLRL